MKTNNVRWINTNTSFSWSWQDAFSDELDALRSETFRWPSGEEHPVHESGHALRDTYDNRSSVYLCARVRSGVGPRRIVHASRVTLPWPGIPLPVTSWTNGRVTPPPHSVIWSRASTVEQWRGQGLYRSGFGRVVIWSANRGYSNIMALLLAEFPYIQLLREVYGVQVERIGGTLSYPQSVLRCSPGDGRSYRAVAIRLQLDYRSLGMAREAMQYSQAVCFKYQ